MIKSIESTRKNSYMIGPVTFDTICISDSGDYCKIYGWLQGRNVIIDKKTPLRTEEEIKAMMPHPNSCLVVRSLTVKGDCTLGIKKLSVEDVQLIKERVKVDEKHKFTLDPNFICHAMDYFHED